ncbi:MAG: hypothetical protein JSU70_06520, partial [Phycisphaerales bacterium]
IQGGQASIYDPERGVSWGEGNIDADPLFADPNNGDYHLKSQSGRWDADGRTWVRDDVTSPCIDAGDPDSAWCAELWPHGQRTNMGAYGGTHEASISLSDEGELADLTGDAFVCRDDMVAVTSEWLSRDIPLPEDLDRNGIVDFFDFAILTRDWQAPPPPGQASDPTTSEENEDLWALRWVPGSHAVWHDVYFGTDEAAVAAADRSSPEYKGRQRSTTYYCVAPAGRYYWRVDELNASGKTKGEVWVFSSGGR